MNGLRTLALVFSVALLCGTAVAVQPSERLADPALEARARALSAEIRCMVCQNESIDASNAPLARDLRVLVRERLQAGDTDAEVKAFLVARYGDFVLLRPPVAPSTWLLWAGPFLVLVAGALAVWRFLQGRGGAAASDLTPDEQARLRAALEEQGGR